MNERTPPYHGRQRHDPVRRLEQALDDGLEQVLVRRIRPCTCLDKYPEIADELCPLPELAISIAEVPGATPSSEFKTKTRRLLLSFREPPSRHIGATLAVERRGKALRRVP